MGNENIFLDISLLEMFVSAGISFPIFQTIMYLEGAYRNFLSVSDLLKKYL